MIAGLLAAAWCLAATTSTPPPLEPLQDFVGRLREASGRKDRDALLALFHTEGSSPRALEADKAVVRDLAETPIAEVYLLPPSEDAEREKGGLYYRPNLPPLKLIRVAFAKEAPSGLLEADLFLGAKDGAYVIATIVGDTMTAAERAAYTRRRERRGSGAPATAFADACANEIGLLCHRQRKDDWALLQCLRDQRKGLMRPCREAVRALK